LNETFHPLLTRNAYAAVLGSNPTTQSTFS